MLEENQGVTSHLANVLWGRNWDRAETDKAPRMVLGVLRLVILDMIAELTLCLLCYSKLCEQN